MTNSIKTIDKTKLQIIKILEFQDEMLKRQASEDEKGYLTEDDKNFVSFSQEFNDLVEHRKEIIEKE